MEENNSMYSDEKAQYDELMDSKELLEYGLSDIIHLGVNPSPVVEPDELRYVPYAEYEDMFFTLLRSIAPDGFAERHKADQALVLRGVDAGLQDKLDFITEEFDSLLVALHTCSVLQNMVYRSTALQVYSVAQSRGDYAEAARAMGTISALQSKCCSAGAILTTTYINLSDGQTVLYPSIPIGVPNKAIVELIVKLYLRKDKDINAINVLPSIGPVTFNDIICMMATQVIAEVPPAIDAMFENKNMEFSLSNAQNSCISYIGMLIDYLNARLLLLYKASIATFAGSSIALAMTSLFARVIASAMLGPSPAIGFEMVNIFRSNQELLRSGVDIAECYSTLLTTVIDNITSSETSLISLENDYTLHNMCKRSGKYNINTCMYEIDDANDSNEDDGEHNCKQFKSTIKLTSFQYYWTAFPNGNAAASTGIGSAASDGKYTDVMSILELLDKLPEDIQRKVLNGELTASEIEGIFSSFSETIDRG